MKLKNKKTGEIGYTAVLRSKAIVVMDENAIQLGSYTSLAELNSEWEDAPEEPKEYWYIEEDGDVIEMTYLEDDEFDQKRRQIGNYFETKEEAEKAVEKLEAFKRLRDKGFRFKDYTRNFDGFKRVDGSVFIIAELNDEGPIGMIDELNICFGGEE
jgi:hypothetical protein